MAAVFLPKRQKLRTMNQFEEKCHTLKVEFERNKTLVWEEHRQKNAEIKRQLAIVSQIKGQPMLIGVIHALKELQKQLKADRDRKMSKFGRTYHFQRKEILAEMMVFYHGVV